MGGEEGCGVRKTWVAFVGACVGAAGTLLTPAHGAYVSEPVELVRESPTASTPEIGVQGGGNRAYSVARVGSSVIVGGRITEAKSPGGASFEPRRHLLAFDAATGVLSPTFRPDPDGVVEVVIPAGDGETVYVGGSFGRIDGVKRLRVARVRVSDGSVVGKFKARGINGDVSDLRLVRGRLWVAGDFTKVAGKARTGLVTLDPTTGRLTPYMTMKISGTHRGGRTTVAKIDVNPKGNRLVAIGNFRKVGKLKSHQLVMLNIGKKRAKLAPFRSTFYGRYCGSAWNSYVKDLDFSPDGRYFVVSTTGGYRGAGAPCDSTARFETKTKGAATPSWVNNTGGDTNLAVEVTDSVVYLGGHARWQNNPYRNNQAGPGAVFRKGIAALDPDNGLPYSWDPGRDRGVGVFDFLHTSDGLYVASDTSKIGGASRPRIALLPPGGKEYDAVRTPVLPADVYSVGRAADGIGRRSYDGSTFGDRGPVVPGSLVADDVRGAFMVDGQVYLAMADGTFVRRTLGGAGFGPAVAVRGQDLIEPLTAWRDDLQVMTGMFFDRGRIYFTKAGAPTLYYRYFTPESGIVGAERHVASGNVKGLDFRKVRGMFVAGDRIYWSLPNGKLRSMRWTSGTRAGKPVAGTAALASSPAGGVDWASPRALFVSQP